MHKIDDCIKQVSVKNVVCKCLVIFIGTTLTVKLFIITEILSLTIMLEMKN
jgi:hypothetical protein